MRFFLAFLIKNYFFFLFLLLETASLIVLFNYNHYHTSVALQATGDLTGSLTQFSDEVSDYFSLQEQNASLAKENARLRNQLKSSVFITDTNFFYVDSIYKYTAAEVINNSVHRNANYIVINKGRKHGIEQDMGVISDEGIVGVVTVASENYAAIMSMLHKDSKVSAMIKKNNQLANIRWETGDYRYGVLEDIPTHIELQQGDTIISSGYSFLYPKGITIGYVDVYYDDEAANLNKARISFATDFNSLTHVYVIRNLAGEEIKKLQEELLNE